MSEQKEFRLLTINPESTSTKIGVFNNERTIFEKTIRHDYEELKTYRKIIEQYKFRKQVILRTIDNEEINLSKLNAVIGRGGLLRPIKGGTYYVNKEMINDLEKGYAGDHPSNLGGILAYEIAQQLNIQAFIVDPVVVDEMEPIARISGLPNVERKSIFHALNQKAVSRRVAKQLGKPYEELQLIVTHMGGGITVGVHKQGRVIDVNNGLNGEGPFSLERAGTVPVGDLISMCYSGEYYEGEMVQNLMGKAGLVGYLNTSDTAQIEKMIESGSEKAALVYNAMAYQIAKEIGASSAVLSGQVDAVILTGKLAYSKKLVKKIVDRISWIADVIVQPGENELQALAEGGLRVLRGEEKAKEYPDAVASVLMNQ